jgi:hypothetical protein
MAIQTVEFRAASGATLTAKLFSVGSDSVVQTASAVTEATNRKGTYSAVFTDPGAAEFELVAFSGAIPVCRWFVTLTLTTATFQAYDGPAKLAAITHTGARVPNVTLVDTTTVNTDMRGTDNAALASAWTATRATYLDSVLIAANSNRTVQVTGSNHVAADIHELQTAVITADKFAANWLTAAGTAADYITELQTAIGTATNQTAIKVVTDRINTGLVADGAVWQFTANMLELAPAGGGGGAGDASQATLLEVQDTVESIAASLSGVPITATGRIADGGSITLYCGDDLRVRSGSQITITVTDVGGSIYTRLDGIGEANLFWGASRRGLPASAISGSIASLSQSGSGASQTMTVVVEIDNAGASLQPAEDYTWQIESQQDYGTETDSLIEMEGVLSLRRRVV